jgi:hypothetical protein
LVRVLRGPPAFVAATGRLLAAGHGSRHRRRGFVRATPVFESACGLRSFAATELLQSLGPAFSAIVAAREELVVDIAEWIPGVA